MLTIQDTNEAPLVSPEVKKREQTTKISPVYGEGKRLLPEDFQPSQYDCLCGRGHAIKSHPGNIRFTQLIEESLQQYANAASKLDKSLIVSKIVEAVRKSSPRGGGFVKQDGPKNHKRWIEIGDHLAREKVGARLRDALHSKYSSSSAAKTRRRRADDAQRMDQIDDILIIESSHTLADRIEELTSIAATKNYSADGNTSSSRRTSVTADEELQRIFNQANWELLQKIKEQGICNDESSCSRSASEDGSNYADSSSGIKRKQEFDIAAWMESDDEDDMLDNSSFEPIPFEYVFTAY